MREIGVDLSSHRLKNMVQYLDEEWVYVIMAYGNANEHCPVFNGMSNIVFILVWMTRLKLLV